MFTSQKGRFSVDIENFIAGIEWPGQRSLLGQVDFGFTIDKSKAVLDKTSGSNY